MKGDGKDNINARLAKNCTGYKLCSQRDSRTAERKKRVDFKKN